MTDLELVQTAAEASEDKRAENVTVLDMQGISLVADYFLICDAGNERQVQAIATGIKDALIEQGANVRRLEGYEQARWILVDTGGIVCHVFHKEERNYYNLERLWGDAGRVALDLSGDGSHGV